MKSITILLMSIVSINLYAASEDECANWLCLLNGFSEPECQAPKRAMMKRIRDHKPPLPRMSECGGSDEDAQATRSIAAYIPEQRECISVGLISSDLMNDPSYCGEWRYTKETHVPHNRCNKYDGYEEPKGCTRTDIQLNVFIRGYNQNGLTEVDGSPFFFTY